MFRLSTRPAIVSIAMAAMKSALFATEKGTILAECAREWVRSAIMAIHPIAPATGVKCAVRRLDVSTDIRGVMSAEVTE